jgi:hypothetical protein
MATRYEVTRDVPAGEKHNHAGRDVHAGEVFDGFSGATWGSVDEDNGVALTGPAGEFFEFPVNAVRKIGRP